MRITSELYVQGHLNIIAELVIFVSKIEIFNKIMKSNNIYNDFLTA